MIDRTPETQSAAETAVAAAAATDFDDGIMAALSVPTRPPPASNTASSTAALSAAVAGDFAPRSVAVPDSAASSYYSADTFGALEVFRGLLLEHSRFETLLQGLCEQVVAAVPDADMAGVTLLQQGAINPETAACSHSRVVDIDTDQYRADEGPCLEAARTGRMVCVRVDEITLRWPTFAASVAEIGVRSFLSAPLAIDSEHAGSLNLYSFDAHGFSDIDEALVTMFVTATEAAIWNARHTAEALEDAEGLRQAMTTRATIEQAKGIVVAARGISPAAAFIALVEQSQRENTKVAVLAARIVTSATQGTRARK